MFCCEPFKNLTAEMGKRGHSIILKSQQGFTFFCLQSRGYDFDDSAKIEGKPLGLAVKVNAASEIGIQYCPFCGTKLADWIAKHPKEADQLARRSEPFVM
jgi:hypothetical protein